SRLLLYNDRCTVALTMRRTDLEKRLKALGRAPTSKASGRNHHVWLHPKREFELYIPNTILSLTQSGNASSRMLENKQCSSGTSRNKAGGGSPSARSSARSRRAVRVPKR